MSRIDIKKYKKLRSGILSPGIFPSRKLFLKIPSEGDYLPDKEAVEKWQDHITTMKPLTPWKKK